MYSNKHLIKNINLNTKFATPFTHSLIFRDDDYKYIMDNYGNYYINLN